MNSSQKLIVRKVPGESFLSLSFTYSSALIPGRQFNFHRKQDELLQVAMDRITQNINKQAEKKLKRLNNKKGQTKSQEKALELTKAELHFKGKKLDDSLLNSEAFQDGAVLKIGSSEYEVEVNPPTVIKLSLPKIIMAGFPVYPCVSLEFAEQSDSKFTWFRSDCQESSAETDAQSVSKELTSKLRWEEVGNDYIYMTAVSDKDRLLKILCEPRSGTRLGLPVESVSPVLVTVGPGECPFDRRQLFTKEFTKPGRFRVMSYNILADLYADSDFSRKELFPTCPPYALTFEYRKQLLLKEIQGYKCDVMCLQEVDTKMYEYCLIPGLGACNYDGVFTSKSGKVAEGVACLYNKNKFSFISQHDIVISDVLMNEPAYADLLEIVSKQESLKTKMLERTNVLQVVLLKPLDFPNRTLCIANTHLYFKPDADNVRLIQVAICLKHIEQVTALRCAQDPSSKIALIFCGDFNSTPEFGIYQLMTTQFIPEDHMDWKSVPEEAVEGLSIAHPFSLVSSCGTPNYTNFTVGFNGCLDYIFADANALAVEEVVPLPAHEDVMQFTALPSVTMPSDHLALLCVLKWI